MCTCWHCGTGPLAPGHLLGITPATQHNSSSHAALQEASSTSTALYWHAFGNCSSLTDHLMPQAPVTLVLCTELFSQLTEHSHSPKLHSGCTVATPGVGRDSVAKVRCRKCWRTSEVSLVPHSFSLRARHSAPLACAGAPHFLFTHCTYTGRVLRAAPSVSAAWRHQAPEQGHHTAQ